MIDKKNLLIFKYDKVKKIWENKTDEIEFYSQDCIYYKIKFYNNNKLYSIGINNIKIYTDPYKVNLNNRKFYHKTLELFNIKEILDFKEYFKVFFDNGKISVFPANKFKIVNLLNGNPKIENILAYLSQIAELNVEDNKDFTYKQISNLKITEESLLGKLLNDKLKFGKATNKVIYPFQTNISQQEAVKIALDSDLSIIQGPPGTGKTETILNIVANLIVENKNIAVVSSNNEATKNVRDKFAKAGYGFINAYLGKTENIEKFFAESTLNCELISNSEDVNSMLKDYQSNDDLIFTCLKFKNDIAEAVKLMNAYSIEREVFIAEKAIVEKKIRLDINTSRYSTHKILELAATLETYSDTKIKNFFTRLAYLLKYGIRLTNDVIFNRLDYADYFKSKFYELRINQLQKEIADKSDFIKKNNFNELLSVQREKSKEIFNRSLIDRIKNCEDVQFNKSNYILNFERFTQRYPVIYSTTHAIGSCTKKGFLYDYVIIDESSQVDLVTAFIAMSCAKRVVLIGDNKQLSPVIKSSVAIKMKSVFNQYELPEYYEYTTHNVLSMVIEMNKRVPKTLLKEHYRCDPQIIEFCNKRFYNNELIIHTKHKEGNGVEVCKGLDHGEYGRINEKQCEDIIRLLPKVDRAQTGIISPYNNQKNKLIELISDTDIEIDTIHKFQGREKNCIMLTTVTDKIREEDETVDFLNNENLINVALSRAKDKLYIFACDKLLNQRNTIISDAYRYYNYFCSDTKIFNSTVYSVFDLMYDDYLPILNNLKRRMKIDSAFPSENIVGTIIDDICTSGKYGMLKVRAQCPLRDIVKIPLTDEADINFVNRASCDFTIYNIMDNKIELIVEVDGKNHLKPIQQERDRRKDRLLAACGIKLLRLPTTSVNCEEKIKSCLKAE